MTVFEYDGKLLIVDCGVLFPEDNQPGVDLILPDFPAIRDRLDDVVAVVLTHGHEDHIGALPYLLRERGDIPLVGLAADPGAARRQAEGAPAPQRARIAGHRGRPDRVRPVRPASSSRSTTRSPTRSRSRSVRRPAWCCTPATSRWTSCRWTTGSPTCARSRGSARRASTCSCRLHQRRGARLHHPRARDRARARPGLRDQPSSGSSSPASPRTCTASSRCSTPPPAHRRKVAYVGRSMVRNMGVARDLGFLHVPAGRPDRHQASSTTCPPSKVVLISTGSQGEPMSALSRIAQRDHNASTSSRATPSSSPPR